MKNNKMKRVLASLLCASMVLGSCMISHAEPKAEEALTNLALNRPATASAAYSTMPASKAFDGIVNDAKADRWSSEKGPEQWIQVDLQKKNQIKEFRIVAQGAADGYDNRIGRFKIEGSNDGSTFTEIYQSEDKTADGFPVDYTFALPKAVSYQYVRLTVQKLCTGAYPNVSLREFEVRGMESVENNLALNKSVTFSAEYSSMPARLAVDGIVNEERNARWSTEAAPEQWLCVDLGSKSAFEQFRVVAEDDGAQRIAKFKIEGSDDGASFKEIYQSEDKSADGFKMDTLVTLANPVSYRYVKITIQKLREGAWPSVSLREFEVRQKAVQDMNENLALKKNAVASSQEADSVKASNAVDGNTTASDSRWGSANKNAPHWIYVDLGREWTVGSVRVYWENRKATQYRIQTATGDTAPAADSAQWKDQAVIDNRPASRYDPIVLANPVQARYVRLYIDSATDIDPDGGVTYNTVSIFEMQVYGGEPPINSGDVLNDIKVTAPQKGDRKFQYTLPEDYLDYEVKYNGTDYEQVIDAEGNIYEPIVDTTVKASFKVTKKADPTDYAFKEFEVTVPGTYTAEANDNAAPEILPELREWKGGAGTFAPTDASRIVIADSSLRAMADKFAKDYKDITGKDIKVEEGTAKSGDFYFALTDASKGLQDEGYLMTVEADKVFVEAETTTGAYWATRTILQSLKQTENIPCGIARDYPLYKVRGFILDVGRKTFTMDFLKQVVNEMSWYKMNDFQVHLNDNLIFLEAYPGLGKDPMTAYSGFRLESDIKAGGNDGLNKADLTSKDVFYTKDEFREFIKDSRVQGVNIVPEFDAPAHSLAFTKVRPDLRQGATYRQYEHLNIKDKYDEVVEFVQGVFNEYMGADLADPVFDKETTVHIGADEYSGANEQFRRYCNDMTKFIKDSGRQPRLWGSLTQISGTTEVPGDGIQINLWNSGWAKIDEMYEAGFDLINCNDGAFYIVPNSGYYHPNGISDGGYYGARVNSIGGVTIPAGDKQMSGAAFAVWNDQIDIYDMGASEYDIHELFKRGFPFFGANLWGLGSKNVNQANAIREKLGEAPNTNFGYEVKKNEEGAIANYPMDNMTDASENAGELKAGKNASIQEVDGKNALALAGGESYVSTPLKTVGLGNDLRVKVKRTSESTEEQILFEGAYGAIKAVQKDTGKVGYSRENYDYSFNYTLPVGEWVELEFKNRLHETSLYVNGMLVDTLGDDEKVHGNGSYINSLWATLMFPAERIGSKTNAFTGYVDDVRLGVAADYNTTLELEMAVAEAKAALAETENPALAEAIKEAEAVIASFAPTAEEIADAIARLTYAKNAVYTVKVDGEVAKTAGYNTKVTVTAKAPEEGQKFVGWRLKGSEAILSTNPTYTFYIANDMEFETCYAPKEQTVEQKADALLSNVIATQRADGNTDMKFVAQLVIPKGYKLVKAGLIWSTKSKEEVSLIVDGGLNRNLKPTCIMAISNTNQFSVTIKGLPKTMFLRGRAFAVVEKDGNQTLVYSEEQQKDAVK